MPAVILCLTKPSILAIHGSIAPCPGFHAGAFLVLLGIIQQYLSSSAIRSRKRACTSRSHGMKPLTLWQKKKKFDDKAPPLCYNQLKALYFCKRHHITVFTGAHHFEEGRPLRIHSTKTWKIFNALCYQLIAGKLKCQM